MLSFAICLCMLLHPQLPFVISLKYGRHATEYNVLYVLFSIEMFSFFYSQSPTAHTHTHTHTRAVRYVHTHECIYPNVCTHTYIHSTCTHTAVQQYTVNVIVAKHSITPSTLVEYYSVAGFYVYRLSKLRILRMRLLIACIVERGVASCLNAFC